MKLYRYQPINKFTLESLILKQNWASNPRHFNDPFEFLVRERYSVDIKGKVEYLGHKEDLVRNEIINTISKFGVVSYSTQNDNILLWSHYSANHTGLCIEYDLNDLVIENLFPVEYESVLPKLIFNDNANFIKVLITKGEKWKYENEYRQIFNVGDRLYNHPGLISEIIFGCRTTSIDIDTIFRICDNNYENDILFSKMSIQPDTFFLSKETHFRKRHQKTPKFWT